MRNYQRIAALAAVAAAPMVATACSSGDASPGGAVPQTVIEQTVTEPSQVPTAPTMPTTTAPTTADPRCQVAGPPPGAVRRDVTAAYGQPATLWVSPNRVGLSTAQGTGTAQIMSASPLQRRALLVDAQLNGQHEIIVSTGREAFAYLADGCTVTPVVDQSGAPFLFDLDHRRGTGDGVGCSDLGGGRHLVTLLQQHTGNSYTVRRTEVDLDGPTATLGTSDVVRATSDHDPAWTTAATISCGNLTMDKDAIATPL